MAYSTDIKLIHFSGIIRISKLCIEKTVNDQNIGWFQRSNIDMWHASLTYRVKLSEVGGRMAFVVLCTVKCSVMYLKTMRIYVNANTPFKVARLE